MTQPLHPYPPPRLARRLLRRFVAPRWIEELEGDLEEQFATQARQGERRKAGLVYWRDVLIYASKAYLRKRTDLEYRQARGPIMLKNYLKIAGRHLLRHKGYAFINVSGLAVGIACCLLIFLFVRDERSYDRFHEKADRIHRVVRERLVSENEWGRLAITPWRLAPLLQSAFPQIEKTVRITRQERLVRYGELQFKEPRFFLADSTFFEVFTFPLVQGDAEAALRDPFSVVLTEATARKYFGDASPLGQVITLDGQHDFTVTGVAADVPENSHFHFDFLGALHSTEALYDAASSRFTSWGYVWLYTYVLLEEGTTPAPLRDQIPAFIDQHIPLGSDRFRLPIQALTDIHLHSDYDGEIEPNGDIRHLYFFSLIALFIVVIACINFMNLATARSAWRAKEIGVRKVVGAHRGHLMKQFLGESVLFSLLALGLALALVVLTLPLFNALTGKHLALQAVLDPVLGGIVLALVLGVGLLAGSYPALYLSAIRPAVVLKGRFTGTQPRAALLRQSLVVFQFGITIVLVIATLSVYRQLQYVQTTRLGFDKENVVVVSLNHPAARTDYAVLKESFAQNPNVRSVSATSDVPPDGLNTWGVTWEGAPNEEADLSLRVVGVDYDYLETLGIELADGRAFSEDRPTDATEAFLVNEATVRQFDFDPPIGQPLRFEVDGRVLKEGSIVGVVKDFHLTSLHEEIRPVMLNINPGSYAQLLLRLRPGDASATLASLENHWRTFAPDWPFEYAFLDQRLNQLYRAEHQLGELFGYFAVLAIFIACLGLFGLAAFTAERRTKEIGIRKALGASVPGLVVLLSRDFARLMLIAFVLAAPLAYFLMNRWLDDFAYRIEISFTIFLLAGLAALGVALLTVSYQAVAAALADPVKSLRYE